MFAADRLPSVPHGNHQVDCIANTDIQSKAGQHWCAFYLKGLNQAEFFDSYGYPPEHYNNFFSLWMREHFVVKQLNTVQMQRKYCSMCGLIVCLVTTEVEGSNYGLIQ